MTKYKYVFIAVEIILGLIIINKASIMIMYHKIQKYSLILYHYMYENILNSINYINDNDLVACESICKYIDKTNSIGFNAISMNLVFIGKFTDTESSIGNLYTMDRLYVGTKSVFETIMDTIGVNFTEDDISRYFICLQFDYDTKDIDIILANKYLSNFRTSAYEKLVRLYYKAFKYLINACKMRSRMIKVLCVPFGYKIEESKEENEDNE